MEARKAKINTIINNMTLLEISFFQRSYVWNKDLWERFLEDISFVSKTKTSHFFGTIILKKAGTPPAPYNSHEIVVDGQQRLTTYIIFMKVLCLKKIQIPSFDLVFKSLEKKPSLQQGQNDSQAFESVMNADKVEHLSDPTNKSKVISAFNYFIDNIEEDKFDITNIYTFSDFVLIELEENEDEQQIFDTINSLGVDLTTSELLKNYFFCRNTIPQYKQKWASVFEKDDEAKSYWGEKYELGRAKRAMIDIFFDSYFQIFIQDQQYNISNKDKIICSRVDTLAHSYKYFINKYCNKNKNIVLDGLDAYAKCYRESFKNNDCSQTVSNSNSMERMNIIIFGMKNSTLIPYILYVNKNVKSKEEREKIYGILESYIMRRIVVHATNKNYNNFINSFISNKINTAIELEKKLEEAPRSDISKYFPTDDDLKDGFLHSKLPNLQSKGILYLLESAIRPAKSSTSLMGFKNYSLEHLMPKKWRNNWSACKTKELETKRDSTLLTLGNLTIITQSLNASIRDASWNTKLEGKKSQVGLKVCAAGLSTMTDVLSRPNWTEQDIYDRGEWLYQKAIKVWKRG